MCKIPYIYIYIYLIYVYIYIHSKTLYMYIYIYMYMYIGIYSLVKQKNTTQKQYHSLSNNAAKCF